MCRRHLAACEVRDQRVHVLGHLWFENRVICRLYKQDWLVDGLLIEECLIFFPIRAALAIPVYWILLIKCQRDLTGNTTHAWDESRASCTLGRSSRGPVVIVSTPSLFPKRYIALSCTRAYEAILLSSTFALPWMSTIRAVRSKLRSAMGISRQNLSKSRLLMIASHTVFRAKVPSFLDM